MTTWWRPVLSALLLTAGCRQDPAVLVRRAVDRSHGWIDHWFALGEGDSVAAFFLSEGRWESPNGPPVVGHTDIAKRVRELTTLHAVLDQRTISVTIRGDSAAERGEWVMTFTPPGSGLVFSDSGSYSALWVVHERRWRIKELVAISGRSPTGDGS